MSVKKGIDYTKDDVIQEIYTGATEVFCQGIAVPCDNHMCGWDWLDFTFVDDILTYKFDIGDISEGIYDTHEFENLTLKEIMIKTKGKFLFEINCCVDW